MRLAWESSARRSGIGTQYPVAIRPTYIHPRLQSQLGCFTIFGLQQVALNDQLPSEARDALLRRYEFDQRCLDNIERELYMMGITRASLFPDLDNLAKDLRVSS